MTPNITVPPRLCLSLHEELYLIDLNQTLYFMADDHYTHVFYFTGTKFMVPFGLSRIEERLTLLAVHHPHSFKRLGRKYIVNIATIHHINITKQQLRLQASNGKVITIEVSKPVLRELLTDISSTTT